MDAVVGGGLAEVVLVELVVLLLEAAAVGTLGDLGVCRDGVVGTCTTGTILPV